MDSRECFLVLGLEPTNDEEQIKKAYREKLAVTNPEDDPEGFKRLRTAYEAACDHAKNGESAGGQEEDPTPSGQWVRRAASVYDDIAKRQNIALWEELFKEDIFQSLEEEENCRYKLLRYLMDHYRLPSNVWKLFDKKMDIVKDESRLKESFPADFINFICSRCERGEDIDFGLFEGPGDGDYDLFLNHYDNCWQALQDKNFKDAERYLEEAERLHIYHPAMEICRGIFLELQDKTKEAVAFMRALYEKHPSDDMVAYHAAEMFWKHGGKQEAADIYEKLKADNDKHYMANVRLSEWYYETGRYQEAKKCAECVLSVGSDDEFLELLAKINAMLEKDLLNHWKQDKNWEEALELCWCYLQDGAAGKGLRLAGEIEKYINEDRQAEYAGLMAKLLVEEAEYEEAIKASDVWEVKLKEKLKKDQTEEEKRKDEDRIRQAYMIRMQSYRNLGYRDKSEFAKAVAQIEAVETQSAKDIGLLLEKAQILTEMEEYERSLEISNRLIEEYQIYAAAANAMEVYRRQWNAGGVVQNARICIGRFPTYIKAYEYLAKVFLDLNEKEEFKKLLEEAQKNEIKSPYLDAYRYQADNSVPELDVLNQKLDEFKKEYQDEVENGEMAFYEPGLELINQYFNWYPGAYMLRRRGSFYKSARKYEEAVADYEKAFAEEPGNPYICSSLSQIYYVKDDPEKALVWMKRAILYAEDGDWRNYLYYHLGRIYLRMGDNERALQSFEDYEKVAGDDTSHLLSMADCLARLGRGQEAAKKLAVYYSKEDGEFYDGYYQRVADSFRTAGDFEKLESFLTAWRKSKRIPDRKAGFIGRTLRLGRKESSFIDYYCCAAWEAMRTGNGDRAIELMEEQIRLAQIRDGFSGREGLEDIIFTAILFGKDAVGKKYAGQLRLWLNRETFKSVRTYYDRPKSTLMQEFLAGYYEKSDEELMEILDREAGCEVCEFCELPRCKELEGLRVLLFVRMGKLPEARERLQTVLEEQPYDEYLNVIKNNIKDLEYDCRN